MTDECELSMFLLLCSGSTVYPPDLSDTRINALNNYGFCFTVILPIEHLT